jgi:hypothetical protein
MPNDRPGEAVPIVGELARKSYYAFKYYNPNSAEDARIAYIVAYQRGWQECLARTAEFAGLLQQVARLAELFEDVRIQQDVIDSAVEEVGVVD